MALGYDPEFWQVYEPIDAMLKEQPVPAVGDWQALRDLGNGSLGLLKELIPPVAGVTMTAIEIPGHAGTPIGARLYRKDGSDPGSAIVYFHGGGMILGSVDLYDGAIARYVAASGVPMLAVDYRLAPEHPHPVPVGDCFAGLAWLAEHAGDYGIDRGRIGVMGDSAGGGLAAGTAILARDRGIALARQILIYPMLDDRTVTPDLELAPFAFWTYEANQTGWGALLGDRAGSTVVPPTAAPARLTDLHGLAPVYIEVGELDIFRDEDVEYARKLSRHGVSTELHVHAGVPHGFEAIAPDVRVSQRSAADRLRAIQSI